MTQGVDGLRLLLKGYVRRHNDAKNPAILRFFFITEKKQTVNSGACVVSKIIGTECRGKSRYSSFLSTMVN